MILPENDPLEPIDDGSQLDRMLERGGEMGALIRRLDWSATPLGPIERWPQSLRTVVSICLFSRFPIHIWWGPDFIELYNDAYRPILGSTKHPASLGRPGVETSGEIWHIIGPMLRNVYENAVSTWSANLMLPMDRYGFTEETYFTLSYSPIFVETGGVGGIFTVVTETTRRVLGERRLHTLHHLSDRASDAKSAETACQRVGQTLADNCEDVPFSLLYLLNEDGTAARLVGSSGFVDGGALNPVLIDIGAGESWPLGEVLRSGKRVQVDDIAARFGAVPPSPWDEHPNSALVLPIFAAGGVKVTGFLVGGVSARLALDEEYRHFYDLIAANIGTAVANARTYEEERKRAEGLAELDRAKTEFFSNVSHEFRTPLTLMLNPLREVLNAPEGLPAPFRDNIETAYRNSMRLQKLVNTLLDFSRIQSNRIQASFEPVDLAQMTADLASNFRSVVERAGLALTIDCPPLPEPVYVDRDMWEKIVLNLLSNAFKFTFEGEIGVTLRAIGRAVALDVRDTGIGIGEADLPHLFERFHRVYGARARTYEGSGIGLALVSELVRFHGGQIRVASAPDAGTTFTVIIPAGTAHLPQDQIGTQRPAVSTATGAELYTEEAMRWLDDDLPAEAKPVGEVLSRYETAEVGAVAAAQHLGARVLVVDDNADMRDYLYRLLSPRYRVERANDGAAALRLIERQQPELVIADVMMPNLNGIELLRALRADSRTRTLPVMLLSARVGEEARIEGLSAGADDYLTKPFSSRELLARIEAQLQLAQLRQETQARIQTIVEAIADPFFALDRDLRFVYVNQHAQELWGKSRAELIGMKAAEVFPPMAHPEAYDVVTRAMAEQRAGSFETYSPFLDRWIDVSLYPNPTGIAVSLRNITERVRIQEALREAEERLRLTIDSAKDYAIFALDVEGQVTTWNSGAERMFGYTEAEIIGQDGAIVYTPEDRALGIPADEMRRAAEVGFAENERWHVRKDSSRFFVSGMVRPIRDTAGTLRGFTKVARDTTARHVAEQRTAILQQLTAELSMKLTPDDMAAAIIEAVHAAIGEAIVNVYLLAADRKHLDRIAVDHMTSTYRPLASRISLDDAVPMTDVMRSKEPLWIGSMRDYRERYPQLDALIRENNVHGLFSVPLEPTPRDTIGVFSVAFRGPRQLGKDEQDILVTIARLCAQALQRAQLFEVEQRERQEAEEANALKLKFLGMISHELRTPLASIKGFSSTLLASDVTFSPEKQRQFLAVIDQEADKLSGLVEQLLDLSRLQSGTLRIEPKPETLQTIIESALAQLQTITSAHELVLQVPQTLPPVLADMQRIGQVFVNLVGNAVKFSAVSTPIIVQAAEAGGQIQIDVIDQGIGIPPEAREAVFEAFHQLERKTANQRLGAGLGLAICKSIIEAHGGRIWIQDCAVGTTISFVLPAAKD